MGAYLSSENQITTDEKHLNNSMIKKIYSNDKKFPANKQ